MVHYFDNTATTRVDDDLAEILRVYGTEKFFNPSARSTYSLQISNDIKAARETISRALGASAGNITFTSGGTEANNLAIFGSVRSKRGNIVVTAAEHSSVYNAVSELGSRGYELRLAKVLPDGHIDVEDFLSKVDDETILACFMHVNNETGAVNDVRLLNQAVKAKNNRTVTFSDGVQAVGKVPVNLRYLGVDLYSFAGHKIHCSKGVGALYVKEGVKQLPLQFGGGQERGLRSGTEYVGGIVAFSQAVINAVKRVDECERLFRGYKQTILNALKDIPDWRVNCSDNVSPAILSLSFADIKGEVLVHMLEKYEIIVGTGSACSSNSKSSRFVKAIELPSRFVEGVVRISFSKYNTADEVQLLAEKLAESVLSLRKTMLG